MAVTELLVGIACVVAQGGPGAAKIEKQLSPKEKALVEFLRENHLCRDGEPTALLEKYLNESQALDAKIYLSGCGSCIQSGGAKTGGGDDKSESI